MMRNVPLLRPGRGQSEIPSLIWILESEVFTFGMQKSQNLKAKEAGEFWWKPVK